jgi:hypothetical protein
MQALFLPKTPPAYSQTYSPPAQPHTGRQQRDWVIGAARKGSVHENVIFALKVARLGDFMASGMRIGGDKGNVPH